MSNQEFAPQPFKLTENNENQSFINAESGRLTLAPQETRQALAAAEAPAKASAQATIDKDFGGLDLFDSSAKAVNPADTGKSMSNETFEAAKNSAGGQSASSEVENKAGGERQQINDSATDRPAPDVDSAKGMQFESQSQSNVGNG